MSSHPETKITIRHKDKSYKDNLKSVLESIKPTHSVNDQCLIDQPTYQLEQHLKIPKYIPSSTILPSIIENNILDYDAKTTTISTTLDTSSDGYNFYNTSAIADENFHYNHTNSTNITAYYDPPLISYNNSNETYISDSDYTDWSYYGFRATFALLSLTLGILSKYFFATLHRQYGPIPDIELNTLGNSGETDPFL